MNARTRSIRRVCITAAVLVVAALIAGGVYMRGQVDDAPGKGVTITETART